MKVEVNIDELLKDALASNNISWLEMHKSEYDINHRFQDRDHETLLAYAISDEGSNIYQYLLQNGANIFAIDDEGETIFHSTVYSGLPERLDILLKYNPQAKRLINSRNNEGVTPLLLAAMLEDYPMCKHLLSLGADVNSTDNTHSAPIHPACSMGNLDIVKLLIEYGADLHIKTNNGYLPLAMAVNEEHEDVIKYLLSLPNIWQSIN